MQSVLFRTSFPVFIRRGRKTRRQFFPFFCRQTRRTEKLLEMKQALVSQYAGTHLALMVQGRIGIQQIDPAPRSPGFCIRAAENDAVRTAVDDSSCAHGARLLGDIQGAAFQPPVAQSLLGRLSVSTWFQPRPITRPSFTTMAPTGTSPFTRAFLDSFMAWRMNHSSEPGISIITEVIMDRAARFWQALSGRFLLCFIR